MPEEQMNGRGHTEKVIERSRALREDAEALAGELRGAVGEINSKLDLAGRMERNPYATLAVAAGLGYVLGGGLFSNFTGRAVRWGVRLMLLPMIRNELMSLGEAASENAFSQEH
jgi:hypothetical protein